MLLYNNIEYDASANSDLKVWKKKGNIFFIYLEDSSLILSIIMFIKLTVGT